MATADAGGWATQSLRGPPGKETVYNLSVANSHTYFVGSGGTWVHNGGPCLPTPQAGGPLPDILHHYTDKPENFEKRAEFIWRDTSFTHDPYLDPKTAVEKLGLKKIPTHVVSVLNPKWEGIEYFKENRPFIVLPHPLGQGGGTDYINVIRIPPRLILVVSKME